jgi:hypothetical protein
MIIPMHRDGDPRELKGKYFDLAMNDANTYATGTVLSLYKLI